VSICYSRETGISYFIHHTRVLAKLFILCTLKSAPADAQLVGRDLLIAQLVIRYIHKVSYCLHTMWSGNTSKIIDSLLQRYYVQAIEITHI